jgi:hypothetical protein
MTHDYKVRTQYSTCDKRVTTETQRAQRRRNLCDLRVSVVAPFLLPLFLFGGGLQQGTNLGRGGI